MFIDIAAAARIEAAEAGALADIARAAAQARAPDACALALDDEGTAIFVRRGSPYNKLLGAGIRAPLDEAQLASAEEMFARRGEALRVELCTLAAPDTYAALSARGYRLIAAEHVLVCDLTTTSSPPPPAPRSSSSSWLRVARVDDDGGAAAPPASAAPRPDHRDFRAAFLDSAIHEDGTGVVADAFTAATTGDAIDDALGVPGIIDYVAYDGSEPIGVASLGVRGDIALFLGSGTVPMHRRRGVQRALLERRLDDARAAGARIAVVTTGTGTRSQSNVMKVGFSVAYARAILVAPA